MHEEHTEYVGSGALGMRSGALRSWEWSPGSGEWSPEEWSPEEWSPEEWGVEP